MAQGKYAFGEPAGDRREKPATGSTSPIAMRQNAANSDTQRGKSSYGSRQRLSLSISNYAFFRAGFLLLTLIAKINYNIPVGDRLAQLWVICCHRFTLARTLIGSHQLQSRSSRRHETTWENTHDIHLWFHLRILGA